MNKPTDPVIRIKLEIEIPQTAGGSPAVVVEQKHERKLPGPIFDDQTVITPPNNQPAPARPAGSGTYVICAKGATDAVKVYAKVILKSSAPFPTSPDSTFATTTPDGLGNWQFDALPVAQLGVLNTLLLFFQAAGSGSASGTMNLVPIFFTPFKATKTACENGDLRHPETRALLPVPAALSRWARMSAVWRLTVEGATNGGCTNCGALNGTWSLFFDAASPEACRWARALPESFLSDAARCLWRLQYNPGDGYWYLDCVSDLDQAPGTWISYRRHESAWDPHGSNSLILHSDSGLCSVPDRITLIPL